MLGLLGLGTYRGLAVFSRPRSMAWARRLADDVSVVSERFQAARSPRCLGRRVSSGGLPGTTGIGYVQDYYSPTPQARRLLLYAAADKRLSSSPADHWSRFGTKTLSSPTAAELTATRTLWSAMISAADDLWTALVRDHGCGLSVADPLPKRCRGGYNKSIIEGVGKEAGSDATDHACPNPAADVRRLILTG